MSIYNPWILIIYCLSFACIYGAWKAKRKSPLDDLPGPKPESFILGTNHSFPHFLPLRLLDLVAGNLRQLMREQVGSYDVKWQKVHGMVARIKAPLGARHLFIFPLSHARA